MLPIIYELLHKKEKTMELTYLKTSPKWKLLNNSKLIERKLDL